MQNLYRNTTQLGLVTLLVLTFAAQVSAAPITTFNSAFHFRQRNGPNSVGLPQGDRQFVGVLNVDPTAGTAVTATQGVVTRPLPFTPFSVFPTMFRALEPFNPALTGSWSISATNGPDVAGPVLTPAIANPQLLPFAQNLQVVGIGPTPTVTWSLPDLTGFDVESLRFRVYNDATNDAILNVGGLSLTTTAFAIPSGLLTSGVPYVFSVSVEDTEPGTSSENVSTAFTQSAYFTEPPDLLVASYNTNSVKRYDGATGAYLGDFVAAGGQANPRGMSFGPDGDLYVGGSSFGAPGSIRRFDGTTGAPLGTVISDLPGAIGDVIFGPDGDLYGPVLLQDYVIHVDPSTGDLIGTIGPVDGASGIAFGADGNLYVGSYSDNQVLRFDGTTGAFIDIFATVPIAGNPGHVADVIFDPDGDLLVTIGYAEPTGNIWRFDGTTGASLGAFIPEADPHPAVPVFPLFGPDGNLYVGSSPDEVFRYDGATGAFIDVFASGGGLNGPFGLAFVPEPGAATQLGAGLAGLIALARRRYRGSRSGRRVPGPGRLPIA